MSGFNVVYSLNAFHHSGCPHYNHGVAEMQVCFIVIYSIFGG